MRNYFNVIILIIVLPNFIKSGVINLPFSNNNNNNNDNNNEVLGLYDDTDNVIVLNYNNLRDHVFNASYSSLLEFYNSFCGHCRRFAPHYKQFASDVFNWSNIFKVMAIDCADDQNNDVCREFEIMSYPTLRYFSPNSINSGLINVKETEQSTPNDINNSANKYGNLGEPVTTQNLEMMKEFLIRAIEKESHPANSKLWPNFTNYIDDNLDNFFKFNDKCKYGILLYDIENSTAAVNLTLNFNLYDEISIRKTNLNEIANKFAINLTTLLFFEKSVSSNKGINLERISADQQTDLNEKLHQFLKNKNIKPNFDYLNEFNTNYENSIIRKKNEVEETTKTSRFTRDDILNQVKYDKHKVYQSDLECALRYTIFHEIIKFPEINGERLLALQSYISALANYNPLGENGKKFLHDLKKYVMDHNQEIRGDQLKEELVKIELEYQPVFSSFEWIGCIGTKQGSRGFTCGLWQLFHFMTVQAVENENSSDPLEVLKAIHDYVKHFFGCTECSIHFQQMAKRRKIWSTSTKDDAILFLWAAHNEVNNRLAGDDTEDPVFPKIQFPSQHSCSSCYRDSPLKIDNETNWNKQNVLEFLKNAHNLANVSRYGVDDDSILPPTFDKYIQKRGLGIVFSEIDLRMGILLYGFCILMMVLAVKLFLYRGYRKKSYSPNNSFVGKI